MKKSPHLWKGKNLCHRCGLRRVRTKTKEWSYRASTGRATAKEPPQCVQRDLFEPVEYARALLPSTAKQREHDAFELSLHKARVSPEDDYLPLEGTREEKVAQLVQRFRDMGLQVEVLAVIPPLEG